MVSKYYRRLNTINLIILLLGNLKTVQSATNLKIDGNQVYREPFKLECSTSTINTRNYASFYRSITSGQSGTLFGFREFYPEQISSCREGTVPTNYTVSCNSDGSVISLTIPPNNTIEHNTYWRCQTNTDTNVLVNNVINLFITVPQVDVSLLDGQVAIKGSTVQLVCSITDYGFQQETRWTVPSTVSGNSDANVVQCISTTCIPGPGRVSRYTYSRDTSGMYLNISNLNRDVDQKLWKCVLQGANPIVTSEQNLTVHTSPEAVAYIQPVIVSYDLTVSSVTLVATSTNCSYPAPVFRWYYLENNSRMLYSSNTRTSSTTKDKEEDCPSPEGKYTSTLTMPRYTTLEGNVHKTAMFQCGLSHPALSEETFTSLSEPITCAVRVTSLFLKDGNTTLTANVEAVVGTKKTLDAVWVPASSSPIPSISCYVGVIVTVLPGSVLTFTVLEQLDGNEIYCTANNTDLNGVSSIKANLNVIAQLTMITLKDGDDDPHRCQDIELQEGIQQQFTVEVEPAEGLTVVTIYCYLGKPEPPPFLISGSPDTNSVSLFWLPGYHGDADQTFHIGFRRVNGSWVKGPDVLGGQIQGQLFNVTVSDLKADTRYEFRISASSSVGSMDLFKYAVTRTFSEAIVIRTCSPSNNIGVAVGGSVGGLAIVVVISVLVVWYCRKTGENEGPGSKKKTENVQTEVAHKMARYQNTTILEAISRIGKQLMGAVVIRISPTGDQSLFRCTRVWMWSILKHTQTIF